MRAPFSTRATAGLLLRETNSAEVVHREGVQHPLAEGAGLAEVPLGAATVSRRILLLEALPAALALVCARLV